MHSIPRSDEIRPNGACTRQIMHLLHLFDDALAHAPELCAKIRTYKIFFARIAHKWLNIMVLLNLIQCQLS